MRKVIILIVIMCTSFNSCNTNHEKLSKKKLNLIKNCINYIENDQDGNNFLDCYLVDPYFVPFLISNHFESLDESFIQLFKKKGIDYYKNLQEKLNLEFSRKYNYDLEKLSPCNNKSHYVLSFSGIGDNIVMAYIYVYDENISNQNLIERNHEDRVQQINDYIFLLDENKNIKEVLTGGVIFN